MLTEKVEKHLLEVQTKVKEIMSPLLIIEEVYLAQVEAVLKDFTSMLEEMVMSAKQALLFLLMKVHTAVRR